VPTAPTQPEVRMIADSDSLDDLTDLLHRAYAPLAAMGFRYLATHQDVATTRRRIAKGECFLMFDGARVIGTIVVTPPSTPAPYCEWYDRPDVAVANQFAIEPEFQGQGFGSRLLNLAERRARELGAAELAVDTAEGAAHLIRFYDVRGYRHIGYAQWKQANYRSVILSKRLEAEP